MISTSLFIYTETSLHAGVGSTVSIVDLPIQRERTTQFPIVQGSGIKGALRSQVADGENKQSAVEAVFGADTKNNNQFAGAISVGDARIVLFPVRSLAGVFAYITCPAVLARVGRDVLVFPRQTLDVGVEDALVSSKTTIAASNRVVLEEFSFIAQPNQAVDQIANWFAENALPQADEYDYWRRKLRTSLVVLHDDAFRDFVQNSTEIVTRVRLDSARKTVVEGALWTQEMLPSDTLLISTIIARSTRDGEQTAPEAVVGWLQDVNNIPARIQLGGDETTGQGMVALRWHGGA
jgi:CRISPR-associated protein Cmr4